MSLLLEALKKAELAKQSADTSHAGKSARADDPVITRDTLPDISQPLEIRANDLPSAAPQADTLQFDPALSVASPMLLGIERSDTSTPPSPSTSPFDTPYSSEPPVTTQEQPADTADSERAAARKMFEAKEVDYNPKRPFYITLGLLGLCAAGYAGYVWWQLQPHNVYSAAGAASNTAESPPPGASQPPAQAAPPGEPAQIAAVPASSVPATTASPAASAPAAQTQMPLHAGGPRAPATTPDRGTPVAPAARGSLGGQAGALPVTKPAARRAPTAASARAQEDKAQAAPIAINPPTLMVDPQIERAYEAFQKGDLATARSQYQAALQREPANRDVLLGLAAVDIRTRNFESAESRYLKILEADPRDALAMAGLIALRGQTDPLQSESRLKSLIAANPDSAHLHFALGNQYAAMVRWPEAQSAYFKAYSLNPDNPDFSFNLAVSLDQLRQGKLALEYYRRALALVNTRPAGFDSNQVSARIAELSR